MTRQATCHGDNTRPAPHRRRTAAPRRPTTSTTSATGPPADAVGAANGSTLSSTRVNTAAISGALARTRRNTRRTVEAGICQPALIERNPAPPADASNTPPTRSTPSARRTSTDAGNNTCVPRHGRHRARRGRNHPTPRTPRRRAHPHPASTPPHPHTSRPAASNRAPTTPLSTITTGATANRVKQRPSTRANDDEGLRAARTPHHVAADEHPPPRHKPQPRPSPTMTPNRPHDTITSDGQHRVTPGNFGHVQRLPIPTHPTSGYPDEPPF